MIDLPFHERNQKTQSDIEVCWTVPVPRNSCRPVYNIRLENQSEIHKISLKYRE